MFNLYFKANIHKVSIIHRPQGDFADPFRHIPWNHSASEPEYAFGIQRWLKVDEKSYSVKSPVCGDILPIYLPMTRKPRLPSDQL